jgi:hypothetical protein
MKLFLAAALVILSIVASAQNTIPWDGQYELQIADFQSPVSQIGDVNMYSFSAASTFDFAFQMSSSEFMFTKNFNSKVDCSFKRELSVLVAPDTTMANNMVAFSRYEFDLCELYARKVRKKLFEEKGAFSDPSFFRPIFEATQKEYAARRTIAARDTEIGANSAKLNELRAEVLSEIEELADFCKACKPSKKKK